MEQKTVSRYKSVIDFKELFLHSPLAIYICDADGYVSFFNRSAAELWGRSPEIGKDLWCGSWKKYYPDGSPMPLDECPMALTLKTGKAHEGREIIIERPDHSFRHLLVYPRPFFNSENELIGAHNSLVDISMHKTSEQKDSILSAIVESSDDAIISKNLDGIITSWNKAAQKIFGYDESEAIGKHISFLIPHDLLQEEEIIIGNIRSGNKVDHFKTVRLSKSGQKIHVSLTVSPVKDNRGNIIGASKIARDITRQLENEREIKQNARRLEILNSIGKSVSEKLDAGAILQKVTDATTSITGAAYGAFFYNAINEQGEAYMLFALSGAKREDFEKFGMPRNTEVFEPTFSGTGIIRRDDIRKDPRYGKNTPCHGMPEGHLPVVSYLAIPVISNSGIVIGGLFFGHPQPAMFTEEHEKIAANIASMAAVALDNTQLFEQVKILNAKKNEFIALASHELKTPLTTVKGYLQILQKNEKSELKNRFFDKTIDQVNRLNTLISDLFDISRIEAGKLSFTYEYFDMEELLTDVVYSFQYITDTHKIIIKNTGRSFPVQADRQRIEQVINNLLTNAVKYSPGADEVIIELINDKKEVTVKIKDKGVGLSDKEQKKIFTRFYRVEGDINITGLGLGLYLSKEIITRHKGKINVTSELGKGSAFSFSLPVRKS